MKRLSFAIVGVLALMGAGCGVAAPAATGLPAKGAVTGELTVIAAASLTGAFEEIGRNFGAVNGGSKVVFNFAGSNALAAQIGQGAPADVFASANMAQMDVAVKSGRINGNTMRTFARNRLVMIVAKGANKLTRLQDLANPGLKVVLADKAVPVGQYALDYLDKAGKDLSFGTGYKDGVIKNVVSYEQDVKAVLAKVALGEADAGIVYATDVPGTNADKVLKLDIPDALNTLATYPIGVLLDAKNAVLALKFFKYVLSTDGQAVLAKYGFIPATGSASGAIPTGDQRALLARYKSIQLWGCEHRWRVPMRKYLKLQLVADRMCAKYKRA